MPHDVFFSYRTREADLAAPLLAALEAEGLTVWRDKTRLDAGDAISQPVRDALAASRTLLAFYSAAYNDSPVCQWELATAWSAARAAGPPTDRVLLALPPGVDSPQHVHLVASGAVGDHRPEFDALGFHCPPEDAPANVWAELGRRIADRVRAVDARTFGAPADLTRPTFHRHKPDRSNRFVGRLPDLWRLDGLLHAGRNFMVSRHADSVAQVVGMGGVGKTLFATEYVWRFAPAWPGGVIWITEPSRDPDDVLYELAPHLNPALAALDRDGRVAAARQHLENKRYLWVLDNVAADLTDLGQRCAPTASGATLITTRSRAFRSIGLSYDLDVLTPADALALLTKDRPASDADRPDAVALCQAVGHHPLAVDVLRGLVAQESRPNPFAAWRQRLADPNRDALALADVLLADERLPNDYARSIALVLQSSLADLSPAGWDILRAASQLAELPIPADLLDAMLADVDGATADDALQLRRAAGANAAIARSLARRDGDDVVVHTLVSRVVRTLDDRPDRAAKLREVVPGALLGLLQGVQNIRTHARLASVVEHTRAETAGKLDVGRAQLAGQLAIHDKTRGDTQSARTLEERAISLLGQNPVENHRNLILMQHNFAITLQLEGNVEHAFKVLDFVSNEIQDTFGENCAETLRAQQDLAVVLSERGDHDAARKIQTRVLDRTSRLKGADHVDTARVRGNLAVTLFRQRRLQEARRLQERSLATLSDASVDEPVDRYLAESNLALTLREQGIPSEALAHFNISYNIAVSIKGKDHPESLVILANIAGTLIFMSEYFEAQRLFEEVLEAQTRVLGKEHPNTVTTIHNLACLLLKQTKLLEAKSMFEYVLSTRYRILQRQHPDISNTHQQLAVTLDALGDRVGAVHHFQLALRAQSRTLSEAHPATRATRFNLLLTLLDLGEVEAARPHLAALSTLDTLPDATLSATDRQIRAQLPALRQRLR